MLALVAAPGRPGNVQLTTIDDPRPRPDQALIAVHHASANFGELRHPLRGPGEPLGYDAAGIVVAPAADGSGPAAGTRVVGFGAGAWAQLAAISTDNLAEVPATVDLADAACLPVAGAAALRTLRASGSLAGKRVLITGASGGVGRFAVQLARLGGAEVVAAVGSAERAQGLTDLGATEIAVGLDGIAPVDVVLDNVGGSLLVSAWGLLRAGGVLHCIGATSGEPANFPAGALFSMGEPRRIQTYGDVSSFGPDLAILAGLLAAGDLVAPVGWRGPWDALPAAAAELFARRVLGKIVLDVPPENSSGYPTD
ncbi:zinc-binding dehydrogenase [Hamadaea tsunoensis]|uniref:zinc-binding dehydrogenase n=1 Tax=Hamadaea tsunoensis TaxID=53368 RepID=UPI0005552852|nr:zinc-binding dehydrogenase [Hamadaea tsunoensis]